jgi:large subunit ribosomal protein L10
MARVEKEEAVREIADRFSSASAALLTEYRGLSVGDMAEVRTALRDVQADYRVLKNTLARIAVREVGLEDLVSLLQGPTAIAFVRGDAVEAAKALDDASKKFPVLVIKGGVLDGKIVDADQARLLARLESRDIQLTKIAMLANQPLQQTINVFAALLRDLGSMLAQVVEQKAQGGAGATEPTEEEKPPTSGQAETEEGEPGNSAEEASSETPDQAEGEESKEE